MSGCCGDKCSCGTDNCQCGSKKKYFDLEENSTTTETTIIGFAPAKSELGGFEMTAEAATENGCKCGSSSCTGCGGDK